MGASPRRPNDSTCNCNRGAVLIRPNFNNNLPSLLTLACGKNGVCHGLPLYVLSFFLEHPAAATVNIHMVLHSRLHKCQIEGTVMPYCKDLSYLVVTNATGYVTAKMKPAGCVLLSYERNCIQNTPSRFRIRLSQPTGSMTNTFCKDSSLKHLRVDRMNVEYRLILNH